MNANSPLKTVPVPLSCLSTTILVMTPYSCFPMPLARKISEHWVCFLKSVLKAIMAYYHQVGDNMRVKSTLRAICIVYFVTATGGCGYSFRRAADGYTLIPLEGLGKGLPANAPTNAQRQLDFEALYVRAIYGTSVNDGSQIVTYFRFWPSGQVLARMRRVPKGESKPSFTASDGDIDGDQLLSRGAPAPAKVGVYSVHGTEIIIELFCTDVEGPDFWWYRGEITPKGIVIKQRRPRDFGPLALLANKDWQDFDWGLFESVHVGPMKGQASW